MTELRYDVIVLGGGPAGLAAAISAHKNGANVLLIEREHKLGRRDSDSFASASA